MTAPHPGARRAPPPFVPLALALGLTFATGCASSTATFDPAPPSSATGLSITPPSPDPRVGLKAGVMDAGEAVWNMRVLSKTPPAQGFRGNINSDLAFTGNYVIQGNFGGYQVWDISNPSSPTLRSAYICPASQSDVSVYGNLLFLSGEGLSGRIDCRAQFRKVSVDAKSELLDRPEVIH